MTHEEEKLSTITTIEQLEDILHHYLTVLERWQEDRRELAKQIGELGKSVVRLSAQLDKYKDLEERLRGQLKVSIHDSAHEMARIASDKFSQSAIEVVDKSSYRLNEVINSSIHKLNKYAVDEKSNFWIFLTLVIGLTLGASVLIAKVVLPDPVMPLTGDEVKVYENGQLFNAFWPKLSKKEQKRLMNLASSQPSSANDESRDNNSNVDNSSN